MTKKITLLATTLTLFTAPLYAQEESDNSDILVDNLAPVVEAEPLAPTAGPAHGADRVTELENTVREMRGQMEEMRHLLRQKEATPLAKEAPQYGPGVEPEEDVTLAKAPTAVPGAAADETPADHMPEGSAQHLYDKALGFLNEKAYPEAERAFKALIADYPQDPLTINAKYWLGEAYFAQKHYDKAMKAFADVYKAYRKLDKSKNPAEKEARKFGFAKAPEALLKMAMTLKAQGKREEASATLEQLREEFPQMPASVKKLAAALEKKLSESDKPKKAAKKEAAPDTPKKPAKAEKKAPTDEV